MLKAAFEYILSQYRLFFSDSGFGLLYFICLFYILVRNLNKKIKWGILLPSVLLAGAIFFPITAKIMMKLVGQEVYWRCFWALPTVAVAAFAGTELISSLKGKGKKLLLLLTCVCLLVVNGTFIFSNQYFTEKENSYKLPQEVLDVIDIVSEHAQENNVKAKRIVSPAWLATYARIYDASTYQSYGRNMIRRMTFLPPEEQNDLYREINSDTPDFDILTKMVKKLKYNYVVMMKEAAKQQEMEKRGYEWISETENHVIFFDHDIIIN